MANEDRIPNPFTLKTDFSPDKFLTTIAKRGDLAKPSKFIVNFIGVPGLFDVIPYLCEVAELPGYNVNSLESKVGALSWYVPSTASMNDLTLTVLMPSDMGTKSDLDDLIRKMSYFDGMFDARSNRDDPPYANYLNEMQLKIRISQLPESGEAYFNQVFNLTSTIPAIPELGTPEKTNKTQVTYPVSYWRDRYVEDIENAVPVSMQPLPLNWGDTDGVHRLQMTFRYHNWRLVARPGDIDAGDPIPVSPDNKDG